MNYVVRIDMQTCKRLLCPHATFILSAESGQGLETHTTLVCDDPYIKYYTVHSPAYTAVPMIIRKYTRHVLCLYIKLGNDSVGK